MRELGDLRLEPDSVAFPLSVVRRQGGQAKHNRVTAPKRLQRLVAFPHTFERTPGLRVRHRKIAPPAGVAGIGLRQAVDDGEAVGRT